MPKHYIFPADSTYAIEEFNSKRKVLGQPLGQCWFVRDASWITDAEVKAGRRPPTVGCFSTEEEALDFCKKATSGEVTAIPHESNFTGWPELRKRVRRVA